MCQVQEPQPKPAAFSFLANKLDINEAKVRVNFALLGYVGIEGSHSIPCYFSLPPYRRYYIVDLHAYNEYNALFILEESRKIVICVRYFLIIECTLITEDGTFESINTMRMSSEIGFGAPHSVAPNGRDIWISGGIIQQVP